MNAKQLQYATELAKSLNFSHTANLLGISQPALSKQITALEKELSVELFDRATSPLKLTAAGKYFIREAETLLWRENKLLCTMAEFKEGKRGALHIGISPFRSQYLIPRLAAHIKKEFPEVQIVLHEEGSDALRRSAAEGKYDFAVVNLPVDESILDVQVLKADTLVLAVPEALVSRIPPDAREQTDISLSDCAELDFITLTSTQEMRQLFDGACAAANLAPKIAMEVVGLSTAFSMCSAGIGATLIPLEFVQSVAQQAPVRLYTLSRAPRSRQPVVVTRRGAYLSKIAQEAISFLVNE